MLVRLYLVLVRSVSIAASENDNEIYEITGLQPNRLYYIVVTAANSLGSGAGSSITAQTAALLPVPPIVMVPTGADIMSDQLRISWAASSRGSDGAEITGYVVYWTEFGQVLELRSTVNAPTTSYVIPGLRAETTYQIAVAAVNRSGVGSRSMLTIQTAQIAPPSAPQALRPANVTPNTIVVSWERPNFDGGELTTYTISWDVSTPVSGVSTTVSIAASENGNEIYEITGLLPNRLYYIVVTAANSRGSGAGSSITAQTAALLPVAPIVMVPTGEDIMSDQLRISWAASSRGSDGAEITGYVVYWTEFGQMLELRSTVNAPIISYVIPELNAMTRYRITVAAVNRSGVGSRSIPLEVRTLGLATMVAQTISVGFTHSCAVYDGAAWCWGEGALDRLGDGLTTDSPKPVKVFGLNNGVTAISVSKMHSCAIHNEAAKCWGDNSHGQIGDGTSTPRMTPAEVFGLNRVTAISAGLYAHTCAIQDGEALCWGLR